MSKESAEFQASHWPTGVVLKELCISIAAKTQVLHIEIATRAAYGMYTGSAYYYSTTRSQKPSSFVPQDYQNAKTYQDYSLVHRERPLLGLSLDTTQPLKSFMHFMHFYAVD